MNSAGKTVFAAGAAVAAVTVLIYAAALACGFINLDDPYYITGNPLIRSLDGDSLVRIFTTPHLGTWLPLTYLSFALDYHFWGINPFGYHLTNILLHAMNAAMVVLLTDRLMRDERRGMRDGGLKAVEGRELREEGIHFSSLNGLSQLSSGQPGYLYPFLLLFAGLLWSIHPLRVESVAWAAERKDLVNGLFTLASVLAYLRFARMKDAGGEKAGWLGAYLLSVSFFACSLMAKQVSVTLPVVLLILDWYPLRRLRRERLTAIIVEKIPFFTLSLAITLMVIVIAAGEKLFASASDMPLYVRVLVSGNAVFEYCRFTLVPAGLSPYFVLPKPLPYGYLVKTAAVVTLTLFLFRRASRLPAVAAVWFAFVILLVPMLAFLHAGDDIALAARYTYLPAIGPAIAVAAGLTLAAARFRSRGRTLVAALILGGAFCYLAVAAGITHRLIGVWKDTGTFWSRVIAIEPVGRAYGDRGVYYLINGRSAEAVDDFTAALGIANNTGLSSAYNLYAFRGVALGDIGRHAEAVADFDRAIGIYPHPTYFYHRGLALQALGQTAEAERDFNRAGPNPPPIDWFERGR